MAEGRINLRGARSDHTVSLDPPRGSDGDRIWLSLTPDSPLTYGYEEAGTYLDRQSLGRLLHWLQTGEALVRDDPKIPEPFHPAPVAAEGANELREALAVGLRRTPEFYAGSAEKLADALLAGPVGDLVRKVQAVKALCDDAERVREHNARTFGLNPLPARVGTDEIRRALGGESRG